MLNHYKVSGIVFTQLITTNLSHHNHNTTCSMSDHLLYSLNYCTSLTRAAVSIIGTDHRAKEEWYKAIVGSRVEGVVSFY